jgi:putative DNA primase/helicase
VKRPKPLGSFEDWSDTARGALIWLGMADPVATQEKVRTRDPKLDELSALLTHWDTTIGSRPISAAELIKIGNKRETTQFGAAAPEYEHEQWREALLAVAGSGGAISPQRLGIWLGANQGRIVEGRFIEKVGLRAGDPSGSAVSIFEQLDALGLIG